MSTHLAEPTVADPPSTGTRPDIGRLLVHTTDRPGVVGAVGRFLAEAGANIVSLDQHSTAPQGGDFFQRTEFHLTDLAARRDQLERTFAAEVAGPLGLDFQFTEAAQKKRVAIMVSKYDHCLLDLLWRWRRDELAMTVPMVISNHEDLRESVEAFGVPFVHIPVTRDTKPEAEARLLEILAGRVDLVVLARYMQIISDDFLDRVGVPLINIHHSFLPAFVGANPYLRAEERGVKLIGATAHYVTADLDEGPIIEQDVVRVSHRDDVAELIRRGAEVERSVLARAVRWHCEDRIARHNNSTMVF
ncbi:formyltetrahydrofolate deformylase [Gordonia terrae]|uniref:formyltetrahydrofolate deformylase n=1 Tax=Gordonia hongkongensis TaxID=1701090 RepID=UPI0022B48901|nr:formyltetrahydrofolate deformylase [Gordonia terrae]